MSAVIDFDGVEVEGRVGGMSLLPLPMPRPATLKLRIIMVTGAWVILARFVC